MTSHRFAACVLAVMATSAVAGEPSRSAAERGRIALTTTGYLKGAWPDSAYLKAGRFWRPEDKLSDGYDAAFRQRYGLHAPPYSNDGLPMGLRKGYNPDGTRAGFQLDCLACHGGSIGGQSYVGLGNTTLDMKSIFDDLNRASDRAAPVTFFAVNTARGTVNAGMFSAVLMSLRNTDMSRRKLPLSMAANLPELDTPAWWILAKKSTMYYDGRTDARSVRSIMQFLLGEKSLAELKALEPTFADIHAYIKSIKPPKYPFEIDAARAEAGRAVFVKNCAKCHGTYGENPTYPNKVVELKVVGTDPARAEGMSNALVAHYNSTWLGEKYPADEEMVGYQAPPLDGIWATAPYLHNGSVPTLRALLNSKERPARFLRPPSTDFEHYDRTNVGWKFEPAPEASEGPTSVYRSRFVYDTSRFGLSNAGHTFGDKLSDDERMNVIEYLKSL